MYQLVEQLVKLQKGHGPPAPYQQRPREGAGGLLLRRRLRAIERDDAARRMRRLQGSASTTSPGARLTGPRSIAHGSIAH